MDISTSRDDRVSQSERALTELVSECQDEMSRFKASSDHHQDSACCAEIVRRAATGDHSALEVLLDITMPYARRDCNKYLSSRDELIEDAQQEVIRRLIKKFQSKESPYQPRSMAEYLNYVKLVARSVAINMLRRQIPLSIEQLEEEGGYEVEAVSNEINEAERHVLFDQVLARIDDPLDKTLILMRYTYDLSPQQIHARPDSMKKRDDIDVIYDRLEQCLQKQPVSLEVDDIYRRLELCVLKLKDTFAGKQPRPRSRRQGPKL